MSIAEDFERGISWIDDGTRLNPSFPSWLHSAPFLRDLANEDYDGMLLNAELFALPDFLWGPLLRCAANGILGRERAARTELERLLEIHPTVAVDAERLIGYFVLNRRNATRLLDGLKAAGLLIP